MANLTVEGPRNSYTRAREILLASGRKDLHPLYQYAGPAGRWNTVNGIGAFNVDTLSKFETSTLPSLPDALAAPDSVVQLQLRQLYFGPGQIDPEALIFINMHLRWLPKDKYMFLHSVDDDKNPTRGIPLLTQEDKETFLKNKFWKYKKRFGVDEPARSLRTVSVTLTNTKGNERTVLVSSVNTGDFVTKEVKERIAKNLWGTSSKSQLKNAQIAENFDTVENLNLAPGIVGPFIQGRYSRNISGIYYVESNLDDQHPIEIALTPFDSLLMRKGDFEEVLSEYASEKLPKVTFARLDAPKEPKD